MRGPSIGLTPEERRKLIASGDWAMREETPVESVPEPLAGPEKYRKPRVCVETVIRLAKEGKTGAEIAELVDRHPSIVSYHLRQAGRLTYLTNEELAWLESRRKGEVSP